MKLLAFVTVSLIPIISIIASEKCKNPNLVCIELCCEKTEIYNYPEQYCEDIPEGAKAGWHAILHDEEVTATMEIVEYGKCKRKNSFVSIPFCYSPQHVKESNRTGIAVFSDVPCNRSKPSSQAWAIVGIVHRLAMPIWLLLMAVYSYRKGNYIRKLFSCYFGSTAIKTVVSVIAVWHMHSIQSMDIKDKEMNFQDEYKCPLCHSRHSFRKCRRFLTMPPLAKRELIQTLPACKNCLGLSHQLASCKSRDGCHRCWGSHHTLLHIFDVKHSAWVRMTAWVMMQCDSEPQMRAHIRILLDPDVKVSFYTPTVNFPLAWEKCANRLSVRLSGLSDDVRTVTTRLTRRIKASPICPVFPINAEPIRERYGNEALADHGFYLPYPCCIVLGADVANLIYLGLPRQEGSLPFAQNTIFGMTFFGEIGVNQDDEE